MATVLAPRGRAYYVEGATFLVGPDRLIRDLTDDEAHALVRQGCREVDDPPITNTQPQEGAADDNSRL